MKKLHTGLGMIIGGLVALTLAAQTPDAARTQPTLVVGTFDSRAIAVAYIRSEEASTYLRAQKADMSRLLERAEAAGDSEFAADLGALGPAMQKRIHHQGFGSAPVDDILARIEERLPAIAEQAGVDLIVSKWVLAYRGPAAKVVDVTDLLAAEFQPDAATLKVIADLVQTEPIPLDQLREDH